MEYPASIARFYDLIYKQVRSSTDMEYYLARIREARGPVLEIGVGTGRLFMEAIRAGADIHGIDPSASMLDELYKKLDRTYHSRISHTSAGNFKFRNKFDLILAPFRVFSHILTIGEQLQALNNIHAHLSDSGRFIMDLYVPDPGMLAGGLQNITDFDEEFSPGNRVRRTVNMHADVVKQISYVSMILAWNEGDQQFSDTWETRMRFYHRYELEHLLERSRLKLQDFFGDFNGAPLKPESKEFILVCSK